MRAGLNNIRPRVLLRASLFAALVIGCPSIARADAGIPMLAIVWPSSWLALVPIVFVEAIVARRLAFLPLRTCLWLSLEANLWSTFLGIPLVWLCLVILEIFLGGTLSHFKLEPSQLGQVLTAPFFSAWLGPVRTASPIYGAAAILCVPFGVASVFIETWGVRRYLPARLARRWAIRANLLTYGLAIVALTLAAVLSMQHSTPIR